AGSPAARHPGAVPDGGGGAEYVRRPGGRPPGLRHHLRGGPAPRHGRRGGALLGSAARGGLLGGGWRRIWACAVVQGGDPATERRPALRVNLQAIRIRRSRLTST